MENLENLYSQMPNYARDVKINLQNILNQEAQVLSAKQTLGAILASAYAAKEKNLIKVFENEAKNLLSEEEINGVRIASSLMAMNNIYYRFLHLTTDSEYTSMPAGLRMKGIADHGIEKVDFEIFALAVSIINGCGMCVDAHVNQLLKHNLTKNQVQMVAKIAAVINSLNQVLVIKN